MKFSTRNLIKGTVSQIIEGAVNVEVTIKTAEGVELTSIITKAACDSLGLAVGKEAYAAIKASNVMIGIDE